MADYSKQSPEYVSNGHYRINGVDFMSVWTFKNKHQGTTVNSNSTNGDESSVLAQRCSRVYSSEPDFGRFGEVLIFPVSELKEYYSKK